MAILNQGFVQELNLDETIDEAKAINNLATGSISEDLAVFAGNTLNVSEFIWVNPGGQTNTGYSFDAAEDLFTFDSLIAYGNGDPIKEIRPVHLIANAVWTQSGLSGFITITTNRPHGIDSGSLPYPSITISNSSFDIAGSGVNGTYAIQSIPSNNQITITFATDPGSIRPSSLYNSWIESADLFDVPTPLVKNESYYIVYSNSIDRFKISDEYVERGINTAVNITGSIDTDLVFIRKNEVTKDAILNLIPPEIVDEEFSYNIGGGTIDEKFENLEGNIDASTFLRTIKYRTDEDNTFKQPIRYEGHLRVFDPADYNSSISNIFQERSGVYILNPNSDLDDIQKLRAFSSNANPWIDDNPGNPTGNLTTQSTEMNIGNLKLGTTSSTASLSGLQNVNSASNTDETVFTHKLPVKVNGETYFFLLRS